MKEMVEVKHGSWLGEIDYTCSVCGAIAPEGGYWVSPYCPECGSKMDLPSCGNCTHQAHYCLECRMYLQKERVPASECQYYKEEKKK